MSPLVLYHGTAGATVEAVRRKGLKGGAGAPLLMSDSPEMARQQAVADVALRGLAHGGCEDKTGLVVAAEVAHARVQPEPSCDGAYWVKRVRPERITSLTVFDASEELADPEFVEEMAARFDF